jgi:hypothetical protein
MKKITAEEFDKLAESGADISEYLDWDKATRDDTKRINIDLPPRFLAALDKEAASRSITRQSLIKVWIYERLHNSIRSEETALEKSLLDLANYWSTAEKETESSESETFRRALTIWREHLKKHR